MNIEHLFQELCRLAKDLSYTSETDAPITPHIWENHIPELASEVPDEQDFDDFFQTITQIHDWQDDAGKAQAIQFGEIAHLMKQNLADLHIWRVGKTDIDIYIAGKTPQGNWIGLQTFAVET